MQDKELSPHVQQSSGQGSVLGANPYSQSRTFVFPGAVESSISDWLVAFPVLLWSP